MAIGPMKITNNSVEIVTVHYQTEELLRRLILSYLKYIPEEVKLRVIDGGGLPPDGLLPGEGLINGINVSVEYMGYNIHHGPGMDHGIRTSDASAVLLLDTDLEIKCEGLIEFLLSCIPSGHPWLAIGKTQYVDLTGRHLSDDPTLGGIPYPHPSCLLVNTKLYPRYLPFVKHPSPCIFSFSSVIQCGMDELLIDTTDTLFMYVKHETHGTISRWGLNLED